MSIVSEGFHDVIVIFMASQLSIMFVVLYVHRYVCACIRGQFLSYIDLNQRRLHVHVLNIS